MAYQNNNNRLTPKEAGLTSITPMANPVEQEIRYFNHSTAAQDYNQLANSLYALGKGIVNIDDWLKQQAKLDASVLITQDDLNNNNQHDWKVAQERIEGLNKFNPHVKDSYQSLAAKDVTQSVINGIAAYPNLHKLPNADFDALIKQGEQQVLQACKDAGISVRQAAPHINAFNASINEIRGKYAAQNAEYTHKLGLQKISTQLTTDMYNTINNKGDINALLNSFSELNPSLPKDEKLGIISETAKSIIKRMAVDEDFKPDLAELTDKLGAYKVENLSLKDIDSDFAFNMKQYYNQAKYQAFVDKQQEYQAKQFDEKIRIEDLDKELAQYEIDNPDISFSDYQDKVNELAQKYGVPQTASKYVISNLQYRNALANADNTKTDEDAYISILKMMGIRDTDIVQQAIVEAIDSGLLSKKDAENLWNKNLVQADRNFRNEQKAEAQALKAEEKAARLASSSYKSLHNQAVKLSKDEVRMKELNKIDSKASISFLQKLEDIQAEALINENDPEKLMECSNKIKSLLQGQEALLAKYRQSLREDNTFIDYSNRANKKVISSQVIEACRDKFFNKQFYKEQFAAGNVINDDNRPINGYQAAALGVMRPKNSDAISKFGTLRNTSGMQKSRTLNGKTTFHKSYDYGAAAGTEVYLPRTTKYAVCVDTYKSKVDGNGAAFACFDGKGKLMGYVRYHHIDGNYMPEAGVTYDGGAFGIKSVAKVGKKDKISTGEHLDVTYFDAKGNIVTDEGALKAFGITGFSEASLKSKLKK